MDEGMKKAIDMLTAIIQLATAIVIMLTTINRK